MPSSLGAHSAKLAAVRDLLARKGRREQRRFTYEGPTLLDEALGAGAPPQELYATPSAYERYPVARRAEECGVPVYVLDERALARLSDVRTPSGLVAVAPMGLEPVRELFQAPGAVLVLAGVGDPGNAGTLLRSAEAFGVDRVVFGAGAVEPYNPKVVRSAMGALFRLRLATAEPEELQPLLAGWEVTGLAAGGSPLHELAWAPRTVLLVGSERDGLGRWGELCTRTAGIPMAGKAESLNAAAAGSIALYEATRRSGS